LGVSANLSFSASLGIVALIAFVVMLALLALVGVIMLLVHLFKEAQKNSPEGKLKSAEEAAASAAEAADAAAEAYDNLNDSLKSLDDKYENLDNLTRGTREWRDAVSEINSEVMDLIAQYPELAKFVKNEDGVMTIDTDSEEVQNVLSKYEQQKYATQSAEIAAKQDVV
jgi:hypothetical protein